MFEKIELVLTIVLTVAIATERTTEVVKSLYLKAKNYIAKRNDTECTKTEKIIMSEAVGIILCIASGISLDINVPALVQQAVIGLAASIGSNVLHSIIGLVAAFKETVEGIKQPKQ